MPWMPPTDFSGDLEAAIAAKEARLKQAHDPPTPVAKKEEDPTVRVRVPGIENTRRAARATRLIAEHFDLKKSEIGRRLGVTEGFYTELMSENPPRWVRAKINALAQMLGFRTDIFLQIDEDNLQLYLPKVSEEAIRELLRVHRPHHEK